MPETLRAWEPKGIPFDSNTWQQARDIAALPFVEAVRLMPDAHVGIGATVGSVIATKGAVVPSAVGVDLGCGMLAQKTSLSASDLPDSLVSLRELLERTVPVGFQEHQHTPSSVTHAWERELAKDFERVVARSNNPKLHKGNEPKQLGTMGGGNHFLEICLDLEDQVWFMLHSGSRGVGNRIGQHYITAAYKDCERAGIPVSKTTGWLTENTELFNDYLFAVEWAQRYAWINRQLMMARVLSALHNPQSKLPSFVLDGALVQCHHNYISRETHWEQDLIVTRKGAVSARLGEFGIIPGSMGAKSFIVVGKGNPDSMNSCSHGAGRMHSRTKAKELFSVNDLENATKGVECRKDAGVLDEIPQAYKSIEAVMEAQEDLVSPVAQLKQILCIKG